MPITTKKILQFVSYFPPHTGGMESHAAEWTQAWTRAEYGEVLVVTSQYGQNTAFGLSHRDGYDVCVVPCIEIVKNFPIPRFWTREFREVYRVMRDFHPDICITRTRFFPFTFMGGMIAKFLGVRWVHIEHGSDFVRQGIWWIDAVAYLYDQTIGRAVFVFSDEIIAISEGVKDFVGKFVSRSKLATIPVIYRGVDFADRSPCTESGTIRIGFAGRLVNNGKGLDRAIEALARLAREESNLVWSFHIAGDGTSRVDYERMIRESGIADRTTFLGHLDKMAMYRDFYPSIDVLLNPSRTEWLPTTVIEALYNDCVVVATDVGGTREISDRDDLLLVPHDPFDQKIFFATLREAIRTHADRRGSSRDLVIKKFFWGESICDYARILLW